MNQISQVNQMERLDRSACEVHLVSLEQFLLHHLGLPNRSACGFRVWSRCACQPLTLDEMRLGEGGSGGSLTLTSFEPEFMRPVPPMLPIADSEVGGVALSRPRCGISRAMSQHLVALVAGDLTEGGTGVSHCARGLPLPGSIVDCLLEIYAEAGSRLGVRVS